MIRILTLSVLVATLWPAVLLADERPNFVLIISDDHRADWMGHKGHPHMETPHLDRLAAEGISFPNAFATSGVCSPSRASILTGRYAHRASAPEIVWCNASFLENQVTLAENLQTAGYRTGYIGGGLLWMNRAYAETTGRPYQPGGLFNEKCSYPLGRKTSTAVFRGIAPPSLRAFQIEVQLPAGQARFLPEHAEAAGG